MNIELTNNEKGYLKARELRKLLSLIEFYELEDKFDHGFINELDAQINDFLSQEEFKELDEKFADDDVDELKPPSFSLARLLRELFGPSRREIALSKQREELIERAEHAETSAFEALAETAEIAKQRDEALARIKQLEAQLKQTP